MSTQMRRIFDESMEKGSKDETIEFYQSECKAVGESGAERTAGLTGPLEYKILGVVQ